MHFSVEEFEPRHSKLPRPPIMVCHFAIRFSRMGNLRPLTQVGAGSASLEKPYGVTGGGWNFSLAERVRLLHVEDLAGGGIVDKKCYRTLYYYR